MGKRNKDLTGIENTTWELFKNTGEISYYLLYKKLKEK